MSISTKEKNAKRWEYLKNVGFSFKKGPLRASYAGFIISHSEWNFCLTIYIDYNKKMSNDEVYEKWLQSAEEYTCLLKSKDWIQTIPQIFTLAQDERLRSVSSSKDHTTQGALL